MPTSASPEMPPAGADPHELEWRVHLAAGQPGRAALVILAAVAAGGWAVFLFRHPVPGLAALLLLLAATGEFLFPTTYRLTAEGAEARNPFAWRKMTWSEVRRVYVGEREVKLSPLKYAGRREAFRGVLLRCDGERDQVLRFIRELAPHALTTEN